MTLSVCDWKHGKKWVYSITYDEGLVDLHRFVIPHHEACGIPGHVEVVASQLGEIRKIGQSSYNGMRHMNGDELKDLLQRGWGVGNHSWSHEVITPEMLEQELKTARDRIEAAIDAPCDLYCSPGNNMNMSDHVLEYARELGYLGAMSLTDALNRPGDELFWINRTALHDQLYEPFYSEYDPFRNIRHAQQDGGWIIDYCHCPIEEAIHPRKDCSEAQLRRRFDTVLEEGGEEVWCAVPEEVVYYHQCRRHLRVETVEASAAAQIYRLSLPGLSDRVSCHEITVEAEVPAAWCRYPQVRVDGVALPAQLVRPRTLRTTIEVSEPTDLRFGPG